VWPENGERATKGRTLWKPRRELRTPTPSVRSQEAFARRLLYATRLVVPLKHPLVKTDKGRMPSRRNLKASSFQNIILQRLFCTQKKYFFSENNILCDVATYAYNFIQNIIYLPSWSLYYPCINWNAVLS
jgi:hypothetical protein